MVSDRVKDAMTPTVVVVDDDTATLSALQRAFRDEPYEVLATESPYQALAWVKSRPIALVIADEFMPEMLGTELLEMVRRHSPRSASILLTGYPKSTVASRAFQQRVDVMLLKPWDEDFLKSSIRRLLS